MKRVLVIPFLLLISLILNFNFIEIIFGGNNQNNKGKSPVKIQKSKKIKRQEVICDETDPRWYKTFIFDFNTGQLIGQWDNYNLWALISPTNKYIVRLSKPYSENNGFEVFQVNFFNDRPDFTNLILHFKISDPIIPQIVNIEGTEILITVSDPIKIQKPRELLLYRSINFVDLKTGNVIGKISLPIAINHLYLYSRNYMLEFDENSKIGKLYLFNFPDLEVCKFEFRSRIKKAGCYLLGTLNYDFSQKVPKWELETYGRPFYFESTLYRISPATLGIAIVFRPADRPAYNGNIFNYYVTGFAFDERTKSFQKIWEHSLYDRVGAEVDAPIETSEGLWVKHVNPVDMKDHLMLISKDSGRIIRDLSPFLDSKGYPAVLFSRGIMLRDIPLINDNFIITFIDFDEDDIPEPYKTQLKKCKSQKSNQSVCQKSTTKIWNYLQKKGFYTNLKILVYDSKTGKLIKEFKTPKFPYGVCDEINIGHIYLTSDGNYLFASVLLYVYVD